MCRNKSKHFVLSTGLCVLVGLAASSVSLAQTTAPSPTPAAVENYEYSSSVEFGARGLEVNGDHEKYRSDLNYRNGFRLFDSSILIKDRTRSEYKLFDEALINASGWGADPSGSVRVNLDKVGIYKFDSNVRRVRYFNDLKTHVVNPFTPIAIGSEHNANTLHNFGDFDLTVFPQRENFRMRLGYSFNRTDGPGGATLRFNGDEFGIDSRIKTKSDDIRAGVEGQLLGFNLGLTYGHRTFTDGTRFFQNEFTIGNNPLPTTATLSFANRSFVTKGTTDFVNFYVQRTFANKLDFTGRIIYAESNSDIKETDLLRGRTTANTTGNIIVGDQILALGDAKRPQTRGDIGLTYRVTDDFRISNTFAFDQFNVGGGNQLDELVQSTTSAGAPRPNAFTSSTAWRTTSYRRFTNTIEADWQVRNWLAFNVGYRFTNRKVNDLGRDINLVSGVPTARGGEDLENQTHSIIAGTKIKPIKNWTIFADFEHGQADNVFTRLANNDFVNFRIRSITRMKQFTLNVSAIARDGSSPGESTAFTTAPTFPSIETIANTKSEVFSTSLDWTPMNDLTLSSGYTYTRQTSKATIIVPVGVPIFPTTRFLEGVSEYYARDNYFYFDVTARPIKRVSVYAAYRISDDSGQGDRRATRPQDFITSYPMKFQSPEVRLAIRLTRNIDWNLGYQYYDYNDAQVYSQNYKAHLPFTSLRIYFGGRETDRYLR